MTVRQLTYQSYSFFRLNSFLNSCDGWLSGLEKKRVGHVMCQPCSHLHWFVGLAYEKKMVFSTLIAVGDREQLTLSTECEHPPHQSHSHILLGHSWTHLCGESLHLSAVTEIKCSFCMQYFACNTQ